MNHWSFSRRITLGFSVLIGCMIFLSFLSIVAIRSVLGHEASHAQGEIPATQLLTSFEREILNARINFIYVVTIQKPGALELGWTRYGNAEAKQRELATLVDSREELASLRPGVAKLRTDLDIYHAALETTLAMVAGGERTGAHYDATVKDWAGKGAILVGDAGAVESACATISSNSTDAIMAQLKTSSKWLLAILIAGSLLSIFLARTIVSTINRLLRGSILELAEAAAQITAAAAQVSSSSQVLARDSSEQAARLEETSSVTIEINSMARQTMENSQSATGIVARSQEAFAITNGSLEEMVEAMGEINSSSQQISKIIKVIDDIAFQTNILALNAAVEAARAGEAGMGFAVVAEEVRNLAQRSAKAAQDTATLIGESMERSQGGKTKVDQVAVSIRTITTEQDRVKTLVDEISVGSVSQSRGIEQMSKVISQMEGLTQTSAAGAEEGAAAAEQLDAQAQTMRGIVQEIARMVEGGERRRG